MFQHAQFIMPSGNELSWSRRLWLFDDKNACLLQFQLRAVKLFDRKVSSLSPKVRCKSHGFLHLEVLVNAYRKGASIRQHRELLGFKCSIREQVVDEFRCGHSDCHHGVSENG